MPLDVAQGIADTYWDDFPNICTAIQWQYYALMLSPTNGPTEVATGVQRVRYAPPGKSPFELAMERSQWYLDAEFGSLKSIPLVSNVAAIADQYLDPLRDMWWWIDP
jgi:hypothetical protein